MAVVFMRSNRMGPYPDPRNSGDRISNPGSCCRDWGIQNFVHTPAGSHPDRQIDLVVHPQDRPQVGRFWNSSSIVSSEGTSPFPE